MVLIFDTMITNEYKNEIRLSGILITSKLLRITEGTKIFKIFWYPYLFFYTLMVWKSLHKNQR